jgi:hypothetical protein
MDENLNPDSATQFIFDYNYYDFGLALDPEEVDDIDALYNATNTITTAPVFADTADGAWDLTLQNEDDLLGSDGKPIGDPRWWTNYFPVKVQDQKLDDIKVYSYRNTIYINTQRDRGTASVYNVAGQLVHSRDLNSTRTEISLEEKGLYIVRIQTDRGVTARRVLLTK